MQPARKKLRHCLTSETELRVECDGQQQQVTRGGTRLAIKHVQLDAHTRTESNAQSDIICV